MDTLKGLLSCFKFTKSGYVLHLGLKMVESFLMGSALPKTQKRLVTCDGIPAATFLAVTTSGVSLLICKNILFYPYSPLWYMVVEVLHLRYSYDGGIGSIVTKAVAQCASDLSEHVLSSGPLLARSCFKFPKSRYSVFNIEQVCLT
jgi:hypothetical protein